MIFFNLSIKILKTMENSNLAFIINFLNNKKYNIDNKKLKDKNEKIKNQLRYQPDGEGFYEAQTHFNECLKEYENLKK